MSKISAVICELNPAHSGHRFIFEQAREHSDTVVAIMSGNFVQRGENAIYDKYFRAESALKIGADLVIELPFPWSSASAEFFAFGAVSIAKKIGVDNLIFGSECGDLNLLQQAAEILKRAEFNETIPGYVRAAEYRQNLLHDICPGIPESLLSSANDILGIEYIKNAENINCIPVKRISCESATSVRKIIYNDIDNYPGAVPFRKLSDLEYFKFRIERNPSFRFAESNGGVGERLYKSSLTSINGTEMFENAKTKQYTNARLRRCALFYLTGVLNEDLKEEPLFTQVLGFNDKGRELLARLRKSSNIAIITKPTSTEQYSQDTIKQIKTANFADSVYTLLSDDYSTADFFLKKSPVISEEIN